MPQIIIKNIFYFTLIPIYIVPKLHSRNYSTALEIKRDFLSESCTYEFRILENFAKMPHLKNLI